MKQNEPTKYQLLYSVIVAHGGTMQFIKKGYQGGAWKISLGGKERIFPSNGHGFEFDVLYTPKVDHPKHYRDYEEPLLPDAMERLRAMIG